MIICWKTYHRLKILVHFYSFSAKTCSLKNFVIKYSDTMTRPLAPDDFNLSDLPLGSFLEHSGFYIPHYIHHNIYCITIDMLTYFLVDYMYIAQRLRRFKNWKFVFSKRHHDAFMKVLFEKYNSLMNVN